MQHEFPTPIICVGLDDLYSVCDKDINLNSGTGNFLQASNYMSINPDGHISDSLILCDISPEKQRSYIAALELQNLDFIGPSEVVKALMCINYVENEYMFVVHKLGNTLLLDTLQNSDESTFSDKDSDVLSNLPRLGTNNALPRIGNTEKNWSDGENLISYNVEALLATVRRIPSAVGGEVQTVVISKGDNVASDSPLVSRVAAIHEGSPYLPPPGYFVPETPMASRCTNPVFIRFIYICNILIIPNSVEIKFTTLYKPSTSLAFA